VHSFVRYCQVAGRSGQVGEDASQFTHNHTSPVYASAAALTDLRQRRCCNSRPRGPVSWSARVWRFSCSSGRMSSYSATAENPAGCFDSVRQYVQDPKVALGLVAHETFVPQPYPWARRNRPSLRLRQGCKPLSAPGHLHQRERPTAVQSGFRHTSARSLL